VSTIRVGLVADTHDGMCDWPAVVGAIKAAFGDDGVDAVLHCGDLNSMACLDSLAAELGTTNVSATRSEGDPPPDPPRLDDGPRVVDVGGHAIGLAFERPEDTAAFDRPVEAVVFGATHAASIEHDDQGILWVNPGSPSLAEQTTVAVLTLHDDDGTEPSAEVIAL
jgi:predicted phosphodiesterase